MIPCSGTRNKAAGPGTLTYSRLGGPEAQGGCGGVESWGSKCSSSQGSPQLWLGVSKQGCLSCPQSCDRRGDCHLPQDWDKFTTQQRINSLSNCREHSPCPWMLQALKSVIRAGAEHRGSHQSHPISARPLGIVLRISPWSCPEPSWPAAGTCPAFPNSVTAMPRLDQHCSLRAEAAQK